MYDYDTARWVMGDARIGRGISVCGRCVVGETSVLCGSQWVVGRMCAGGRCVGAVVDAAAGMELDRDGAEGGKGVSE